MLRIILALFLAFSLPAIASSTSTVINWDAQVEILDTSQVSISPKRVGQWYPVVLMDEGTPYVVKIHNPLDERVRIVVSIDGVDPFSGRKSMMGHGGLVLAPGQSKTIRARLPNRKSAAQALVSPSAGAVQMVDVAFFREVTERPMIVPVGPTPPISTRADKWVPPDGSLFYPLSQSPVRIVHRRIGPAAPINSR